MQEKNHLAFEDVRGLVWIIDKLMKRITKN
jgi:hypothetical protein